MALTVDVVGPAPWGFRISGGRDFHTPIMVTRVTEQGKAEAADLRPGDIIVAINGESAKSMLHAEAQSKIRQSPSPLRLQLDRPQAASPGQTNGESSPEVLATSFQGSRRTHTDSQSSLRVASEGESHLLREDSEVFKMLQENREARVAPRQSSSFRLLQEALEAEERGPWPPHPSSTRMRGHFWVGDELYCEKHARQRYSAPRTVNSQA
ncbi:hypothetical protein E2I00_016953 [Balaenoptera physalus]|uniref:PDZ domain-containing protein n=1 Tax=Balaenoptera physalus TaxID=9770 RepID=A0A643C8U6_BALPH|nr:hypothetical protein E2I00_016953 [Balaenoptera physalus]